MLTTRKRIRQMMLMACGVAVLSGGALAAPQDGTPSSRTLKPRSIALIGCVSDSQGVTGGFTFEDTDNGSKYRLSGKGMKKYAGQKVEIVGGGARKLSIRGGLLPSPNIAARGNDADPVDAAIAVHEKGLSGATELPEFRVSSVRAVEGGCR